MESSLIFQGRNRTASKVNTVPSGFSKIPVPNKKVIPTKFSSTSIYTIPAQNRGETLPSEKATINTIEQTRTIPNSALIIKYFRKKKLLNIIYQKPERERLLCKKYLCYLQNLKSPHIEKKDKDEYKLKLIISEEAVKKLFPQLFDYIIPQQKFIFYDENNPSETKMRNFVDDVIKLETYIELKKASVDPDIPIKTKNVNNYVLSRYKENILRSNPTLLRKFALEWKHFKNNKPLYMHYEGNEMQFLFDIKVQCNRYLELMQELNEPIMDHFRSAEIKATFFKIENYLSNRLPYLMELHIPHNINEE